jgi:hypothetical protein
VSVLEAMKMSVKAVTVHVIEVVRVKTEVMGLPVKRL